MSHNPSRIKEVRIKTITTRPIRWRDLKFIQEESFKNISESDMLRLKKSLRENSFIQPFYVWQEPDGDMYCLDGKHRVDALRELEREHVEVPILLPATFIECEDKQHAAKMVLLFSSQYATPTADGLSAFISHYELSEETDFFSTISLPNDLHEMLTLPEDLEAIPKDKAATIKITFSSPEELTAIEPAIKELLTLCPNAFYSVSCGEI